MKILGIETSGPLFSLCWFDDQRLRYQVQKDRTMEPDRRDAHWFAEVQKIMDDPEMGQIDLVAVDVGPGMFTSLRVGLSLAKAITFARNVPLICVTSLEVMGVITAACGRTVLAVINAYQGEVYAAFFQQGRRQGKYLLTTPENLAGRIKKSTLVIGPGADILRRLPRRQTCQWEICGDSIWWPSAAAVVQTAWPRIRRRAFAQPDYLEPFYIRKSDAERNKNPRHDL